MALSGSTAVRILATHGAQVFQVLHEVEGGAVNGFNAVINSAKDGFYALNGFLNGAESVGNLGSTFKVTGSAIVGPAKSLGSPMPNPIVLSVTALSAA